ncbi:tRNA 2-thiocytidine biosynthesis TtcA family protein [Peptoniphilus sp. GNH]|nr:PP-loop family protein [Clostridiales bacterium KA00134]UHR02319.1 tRNA 2-thiocytidine biosynthesis TtcA family protein [Peptoniphilus sp. GNH]
MIKTYRKDLWVKFIKAVNKYELVEENDKIAVAISGGKDSLTLAKLFQELKKHGKKKFELEFIAMDPGYKSENRKRLEDNCKKMGIPVKVHDSDIFEVANKVAGERPCYMCARMRRGNLYAKAKELGCNKLALGHHMDDVVETILLNIIFSANFKTMMPKLRSENFEDMELIRPMYFIEEESVRRYMRHIGIEALDCACSITEKKQGNMRFFVKSLIEDLEKVNKNVKISIFRSAENVNLDAITGFIKAGQKHEFLEFY